MEKFIRKSIEYVYRVFPDVYSSRSRKGSFHFSVACDNNKIITVGINQPEYQSPKALRFARKLGLQDIIKYPFEHAEQNMVSKLIGMGKLSSSLKVVVLRANVFGDLKNSQPCPDCAKLLSAFGLNRVYWSTADGEICGK